MRGVSNIALGCAAAAYIVLIAAGAAAAIWAGGAQNELLRIATRYPDALCVHAKTMFSFADMKIEQCVARTVAERWDFLSQVSTAGAIASATLVIGGVLLKRFVKKLIEANGS
ncbi:hypothetical protein [Rhizorhabdus argentea]|uniref:hypothetical protein n=1 Tax=Rhizorhabdus argentea TaxID=1387174 RepID=UPI0030ECAE30